MNCGFDFDQALRQCRDLLAFGIERGFQIGILVLRFDQFLRGGSEVEIAPVRLEPQRVDRGDEVVDLVAGAA